MDYYKENGNINPEEWGMPVYIYLVFMMNILSSIFLGAYQIVNKSILLGTTFLIISAITTCALIINPNNKQNNKQNNKKSTYKFSEYE